MINVLFYLILFMTSILSFAANTPCSGKMGGVSHCDEGKFICNNGSVSRSKKTCQSKNKSINTTLSPKTKIKRLK